MNRPEQVSTPYSKDSVRRMEKQKGAKIAKNTDDRRMKQFVAESLHPDLRGLCGLLLK